MALATGLDHRYTAITEWVKRYMFRSVKRHCSRVHVLNSTAFGPDRMRTIRWTRWFIIAAPLIIAGRPFTMPRQQPACPSAPMAPADPNYPLAKAVADSLGNHGLAVRCIYRTTAEGMLGQSHAAAMMTDLGAFEVLFFATPAAAKSVRITRATKNGQFLIVLHGPDPRRPVDSIYSDARPDIIIHNRCLFYLQKTPALSAALRNALRQGKSPT